MFSFLRRKKWFKKPKSILLALIVVIVIAGIYGLISRGSSNSEEKIDEKDKITEVSAVKISELIRESNIESTGVVKSATEVDVVALTNGTIKQLNFEVGDSVNSDQILVQLYDDTVLTNLNNASVNLNNVQLSTETTKRLAEESVRQSEIGFKNAQEATETAGISLQSAKDNLENTKAIQKKEKEDLYNNAVISINNYLNTINNTLNQIDYIIAVDGDSQLPGIAPTLAALEAQSLVSAELSYFAARDNYDQIVIKDTNENNASSILSEVITNLGQTKEAVDDAIWVLESTVPSQAFPDASLLAQKTSFTGLRSSLVGAQSQAQTNQNTLQNIDLIQKQQLDALASAVEAAESQLQLAGLSEGNAQIAYEQSQRSRDQQIISAQTALDNSQGQFSLIQTQVNDLTIKAPIFGQINNKFVEIGDEVTIGRPIASISQSDLVKIEVNLSSSDIYNVALGQTVIINSNSEGKITHIDPSADPITRKVRIEIAFDNSNKDLIPETFVDVNIPFADDGNGSSASLFVPLKSITITQTDQFVFLVNDNKAKKVYVEIGAIEGGNVEVINGLDKDDFLIIDGAKIVSEDDLIELK